MSALEPYWTRDGDDPGRIKGHPRPGWYACVSCCWHGSGTDAALKHIAETTHDVKVEYRPAGRQRRTE